MSLMTLRDECINRNIVECKGSRRIRSCLARVCINRNIVECKVVNPSEQVESDARINRNIVECKDSGKFKSIELKGVLIETLWNVKEMELEFGAASHPY